MTDTITEDMYFVRCEKIVNESWSEAALYYDQIKAIVEKGGPENEHEQTIMMIAANVTLQKMTLDRTNDKKFFDI